MKRTLRRLSRVLAAPSTSLAVGALLIVSSIFDLVDTAIESTLGAEIGVEHGVLLWGAVHALKGLTGVLEDLTDLGEGLEEVGQATDGRQRVPADYL